MTDFKKSKIPIASEKIVYIEVDELFNKLSTEEVDMFVSRGASFDSGVFGIEHDDDNTGNLSKLSLSRSDPGLDGK